MECCITDLERGSKECPGARQVAESMASQAAMQEVETDTETLARPGVGDHGQCSGKVLVQLGSSGPPMSGLKKLQYLEGKDTCRCLGERLRWSGNLWMTKGGPPRLCTLPPSVSSLTPMTCTV